MAKQVSFNTEKFYRGMKIAAQAVTSTLGPLGRNVFLGDPTLPRFTNDGASIANRIVLKDLEEDAGAWVIRSATARAADEAGDGTTTCATICEAIFDETQKRIEPMVEIRRSLREALPSVVEAIKKASHKTTLKDIKHIAEVSAENKEMAALITQIFDKKGVEAQINVSDSETSQSYVRMEDGYEAKVGMMSPWLITNIEKQRAEYKDVPVLVSHKKIDAITQLLPLYEKLSEKKLNKLVIVCEEMDIAALGAIVDNKRLSTFGTLVIRATGELLDDIAAVVGAVPISEQTNTDFSDADILKKLGKAQSVVSTPNSVTTQGTTIFVGKSKGGREHADLLEAQSKNVGNQFEKGAILKRVAKLRSGVADLKIGAFSEQELGYLRDKADDAVKAVRSALEEGYIEGGGMCLFRISEAMRPQTVGEVILKQALAAPFFKILENAGKDWHETLSGLTKGMGYDAKANEYKDLIKAGIIDPSKVARIAVESAVSSIGEMIVTSALITEYVEETK